MPTEYKCRVVERKTHGYEEDEEADSLNIPEFTIQPNNPKRNSTPFTLIILILTSFYYTGNKFYYGVRIVTGDQADADPESFNIILSLTGDKGMSGEIPVSTTSGFIFFKRHFKRSTYDDIIIESDGDLGDIQVVGAGLRYFSLFNILTPDWYVDYVTVKDYQKTVMTNFPFYHWIGKSVKQVTATSATGIRKYYNHYSQH